MNSSPVRPLVSSQSMLLFAKSSALPCPEITFEGMYIEGPEI